MGTTGLIRSVRFERWFGDFPLTVSGVVFGGGEEVVEWSSGEVVE